MITFNNLPLFLILFSVSFYVGFRRLSRELHNMKPIAVVIMFLVYLLVPLFIRLIINFDIGELSSLTAAETLFLATLAIYCVSLLITMFAYFFRKFSRGE